MLKLLVLLVFAILPALAQIDLSGEWAARYHEDQPERIPGPAIGDYLGLPINDAARLRADSWDASLLTLPEHQCKPHPADYSPRGPANLRMWKDVDRDTQQVIAWHTRFSWMAPERTIWMDGRPHPPENAAHTWQGFSTGKWEGPMLTITTTHLKAGWVRRNGIPRSDLATLSEHFIRHGRFLTIMSIVNDPVYLTEPMIRTTDLEMSLEQQLDPYPCEIIEETTRQAGVIPHHLPGTNPFLTEFAKRYHLPEEAARGGAQTMYPEYRIGARRPSPAPTHNPIPPRADAPLDTIHVQGNVYVITHGAGSNVTVQVGKQGLLVVDTGTAELSSETLAAIKKLSDAPIRYVLNTNADADHVGGNVTIAGAGRTIRSGGNNGGNFIMPDEQDGAAVLAHENVLMRMSAPTGHQAPTPRRAWPTDAYESERKEMGFNGETIQMLHQPAAHTDGDSLVYFRHSDVIAAGDVFLTTGYPVIDLEKGGSINGIIAALNRIIDIAIPLDKQEGGTMVVPGHGRICDEADVVDYRDMITIIRDRVQDMIRRGMTLEEVQAARPTADYDPRYGADSGPWTTRMFVEAVYRSLNSK
jgi:cyclase